MSSLFCPTCPRTASCEAWSALSWRFWTIQPVAVAPPEGGIILTTIPMDTINFTRGVPANESFPIADIVEAATTEFRSQGARMLQSGPARGFEPPRQSLAACQQARDDEILTRNAPLPMAEVLCRPDV